MHDNPFTMLAAATLEDCINTRCCPTKITEVAVTWWDTDITGNVCKQAQGNFGETISDYEGHAAAGDP
jgi:hypothetical protein